MASWKLLAQLLLGLFPVYWVFSSSDPPIFILLDSRWWLVSSFLNSTWDRYSPRADSAEQEPDADRCIAQWDQKQPSLGSLQGYGCRAGCDLTASTHIRDVRRHGGQCVFQVLKVRQVWRKHVCGRNWLSFKKNKKRECGRNKRSKKQFHTSQP